MKNNKKGFTIVELVIVIAVIAILASVLVPTFSGVITKAQRSSDVQLIKNVNSSLNIELATSGKYKYDTMSEALYAAEQEGFSIDKIKAKSDYNIAWDSKSGVFVLILNMFDIPTVCYPINDGVEEVHVDISNDPYSDHKASDYFIITKSNEFDQKNNIEYKNPYSIYTYDDGGWTGEKANITVNTGIDTGRVKTFESIKYINDNGTGLNSIIRLNSFGTRLYIDAPLDEINFYGYSGLVTINRIADYSFDAYGTIGRLKIYDGHVEVMKDATIYCLIEDECYAGAVVPTTINYGANVSADVKDEGDKKDNGVAESVVPDCGINAHKNTIVFADSFNTYECCTSCGYTLITAQDSYGVQAKAAYNLYNDEYSYLLYEGISSQAVYSIGWDLETALQYIEGNFFNQSDLVEAGLSTEPIMKSPTIDCKDFTCIHNFGEGKLTLESTCSTFGEKKSVCSKCNSVMIEYLPFDSSNHNNKEDIEIFGITYSIAMNYCKGCGNPVLNVTEHGEGEYDMNVFADTIAHFNFFDTELLRNKETGELAPIEVANTQFNTFYEIMDVIGFDNATLSTFIHDLFTTSMSISEGVTQLITGYLENKETTTVLGTDYTVFQILGITEESDKISFAQTVLGIYLLNMGIEFNGDTYINTGILNMLDLQIGYEICFDTDVTEDDYWSFGINKTNLSNYNGELVDPENEFIDGVGCNTELKAGEYYTIMPNFWYPYVQRGVVFYDEYDYPYYDDIETGLYYYQSYYQLLGNFYKAVAFENRSEKLVGHTVKIRAFLFDAWDSNSERIILGEYEYKIDSCGKIKAYEAINDYRNSIDKTKQYIIVYKGENGYTETYYWYQGEFITNYDLEDAGILVNADLGNNKIYINDHPYDIDTKDYNSHEWKYTDNLYIYKIMVN